jgi:hypothetical protein
VSRRIAYPALALVCAVPHVEAEAPAAAPATAR